VAPKTRPERADVFVLAGVAVESARLLLSSSGRFPNGLANGNDWSGAT
jgi:hypothetical protein